MMANEMTQLAPYIAVASFVVAFLALLIAIQGYRRKTGLSLRYDYGVSSAISSKDHWVSDLTLMNTKDRPATIYKIYIEDGPGVYVEVEDFTDKPMKLEAYGVFHKTYDPIDFYAIGLTRVNGLLKDSTRRKRLVLTTPEGRHFPKPGIRASDDPLLDTLLKNYTTAVAHPVRLDILGRSYGSEAKYLVAFRTGNTVDEVVPIYPGDYEIRKFQSFSLTKDSLASKNSLERFLQSHIDNGTLPKETFEVHELDLMRSKRFGDYSTSVDVPDRNWLTYNVIGKGYTIWDKLASRWADRNRRS